MISQLAGSRHTAGRIEPDHDCRLCPRLRGLALKNRKLFPEWHNGPVKTWHPPEGPGAVRLLVVGLAPGMRGANRTGIPFIGDESGVLLHATLARHGWAEPAQQSSNSAQSDISGLPHLRGTAITNAVRCVPPENKPVGTEINTCRKFLVAAINSMPELEVIVTLGKISHDSTIRALGGKISHHPFAHASETEIGRVRIISSYHCSRYNINTGRLTPGMFDAVFQKAARSLVRDGASPA